MQTWRVCRAAGRETGDPRRKAVRAGRSNRADLPARCIVPRHRRRGAHSRSSLPASHHVERPWMAQHQVVVGRPRGSVRCRTQFPHTRPNRQRRPTPTGLDTSTAPRPLPQRLYRCLKLQGFQPKRVQSESNRSLFGGYGVLYSYSIPTQCNLAPDIRPRPAASNL